MSYDQRHARLSGTRPLRQGRPLARIWQPDKAGTAFAAFLLWLCIIIMIVPQGLDYNGDNGMPTSSDALKPIYLVISPRRRHFLAWQCASSAPWFSRVG